MPREAHRWNNPTEIISLDGTLTTTVVSNTVNFVIDYFVWIFDNRWNNKTVYYWAVDYCNSFNKVYSSTSYITTINNRTNNWFHYWTNNNWTDDWIYYKRYNRKTTPFTTRTPPSTTGFTTPVPPAGCRVPSAQGKCVELSENCNFKSIENTDGNNEESSAKVICRQHHKLNIEYTKDPSVYAQTSTYAYCVCEGGSCNWKFNKGNVQCTFCPKETLQARKGKKQKFVDRDTGIAIYYPIIVVNSDCWRQVSSELIDSELTLTSKMLFSLMTRAVDGWHIALDFNVELAGSDDNVFAPSLNVIDEDEDGRRARSGLFWVDNFV